MHQADRNGKQSVFRYGKEVRRSVCPERRSISVKVQGLAKNGRLVQFIQGRGNEETFPPQKLDSTDLFLRQYLQLHLNYNTIFSAN